MTESLLGWSCGGERRALSPMASASPFSPLLHLRGGGRQHEQVLLLPSLPTVQGAVRRKQGLPSHR